MLTISPWRSTTAASREVGTSISRTGQREWHSKSGQNKWHSNASELEAENDSDAGELPHAKQQLGGTKPSRCKLLGLPWDREQHIFRIVLNVEEGSSMTKRSILSRLAKVYDPLGLASPNTLNGKLLYRDICDAKVPWDAQLPELLIKMWKGWSNTLTDDLMVPRALDQPISEIMLHAFHDASIHRVSAAVYAVAQQTQAITQGHVRTKYRITKCNLTIPRLELIAGHIAVNLAHIQSESTAG